MDDQPEIIRQQMESTRNALTKKIEALENQVVDSVQSTTQAVNETVESVKGAVQDTVSAVKDTVNETVGTVKHSVGDTVSAVKDAIDVTVYVEKYPWASFGVAVVAGFASGRLLGGPPVRRRVVEQPTGRPVAQIQGNGLPNGSQRWRDDSELPSRARTVSVESPSLVGQLTERFAPEIEQIKGLALGALGSLVRDVVVQSVSGQLGPQLSQIVDNITRKLGGEPIPGPVIRTDSGKADGPSRESDTARQPQSRLVNGVGW